MSFAPVLPWWVMVPLTAAVVLGLGGVLFRAWTDRAGPGPVRGWLCRGGLVLLLLLAAFRPGIPGGTVQGAASELDVFFVVDTSSSMAAEDFAFRDSEGGSPRLDCVRQDIRAIAEELGGARFALLTFDSLAVVRMPLTGDTSALGTAVSVLGPQVTAYSRGSSVTAAGPALAERLTAAKQGHPERPRLVFYLGDGEQTSATAPPPLGVEASLVSGGAVLGYGTAAGGRMKENSGDPRRTSGTFIQDPGSGTDAVSRIDEIGLRGLAGQLSVPYVHRAAGDATAPML
ncbi:VWA domain-containing protein [Arthrobacter sp. UYCu712]|uniref:VWA domain-containing protein n=1 Tax=Arthrobacter sp. UYCu712 TaxID=3156340 RepID=UPI00339AA2AB